jgi:hypothetical protein
LVQNAPKLKKKPEIYQSHRDPSVLSRNVSFPFAADVTVDDAAVFSSPELTGLATLSADGLAKYLFDCKAPVSTKGLGRTFVVQLCL